MKNLLYIKANVKPDEISKTYQISDNFVEEYQRNNPQDEIIILDLYKEKIDFLRAQDLSVVFGEKDEESRNHPILQYAYQFSEVDKYVIAAPMWNLSVPAILKAYIDYICVLGITFKYSEEGPTGLLQGKKAVLISSRGGDYSHEPTSNYEMGERYLRTIFGFLGITDFTSISADSVDIQGSDVSKIMQNAIEKANDVAKVF